jgi:hypothetical protein
MWWAVWLRRRWTRVRLHDDQSHAPLRPRLREQHPKQSISRAHLRTSDRAPEDGQLLAQRHVPECDGPMPPQINTSDRSKTTSAASMRDPVAQTSSESTGEADDQVLARHRVNVTKAIAERLLPRVRPSSHVIARRRIPSACSCQMRKPFRPSGWHELNHDRLVER